MEEAFNFKFKDLTKINNCDVHKICSQAMKEILCQIKSKKTPAEKQNIARYFEDLIKQIDNFQDQFNKQKSEFDIQDKIFQVIAKLCLSNLNFHKKVQELDYSYSVIPVVEIGFLGMNLPEKIKIDSLIQEIFLFFNQLKENQHNTKNTQDVQKYQKLYHCAQLISAYYNIQQQKYIPSLEILKDLEKHYFKRQQNDQEVISKKQKKNHECEIRDQQQKIFEEGMQESIRTFKALNYIFLNNIVKLSEEVKELQKIQGENLHESHKETMNKRLEKHIKLFQTHQFFLEKQFDQAKETLGKLDFHQIQEALLIFFNNQDIQCIRNLETIYYNLFSDSFFKIFTILQEIERKDITDKDINQIKEIFQETTKQPLNYEFGKGIILLFMVICSRLQRINNQYQESYDMMVKMFQICKQTNTQFQASLEIFFKYDLLLSYLYQKVQNKILDSNYRFVKKFTSTNMSTLDFAEKDGEEYILKTINLEYSKSKMSKFDILNEITISMLVTHRNIQKVYDLYQNNEGKIVLVQKVQGENLRSYLQKKQFEIDQIQRYGYILQLIMVFQYLHNLNIIHCDLKLENILVNKQNELKIKLIDFGFAIIKLFNKYFKPIGTTYSIAPSELKKNGQLCTFESEIFMIARAMKDILELDENYKSRFLISKEMKQLLENMTKKKLEERCLMSEVIQKFKLDFFILQIYLKLTCDKTDEEKQEQYQYFSTLMVNLYENFINQKYMQSLYKEKIELWEKEEFNKPDRFNKQNIFEVIKQLIKDEREHENFLTCLQDHDIKLLCESLNILINKTSDQQIQIDDNLLKLTMNQKQEDANSKNDILKEYQSEVIDRVDSADTQSKDEQINGILLHDVQKNMYKKMDEIIKELKSKYSSSCSSDCKKNEDDIQNDDDQLIQNLIQGSKQLSDYQINVQNYGHYSGQGNSIQILSNLDSQINQQVKSYFYEESKLNQYEQQNFSIKKSTQKSENDLEDYQFETISCEIQNIEVKQNSDLSKLDI